jgi:diguanylate cyclase (GGDEF)-like protein
MSLSYSPWLVSLSVGVAILVAYTSLQLAARVADSQPLSGKLWLGLGAISMGIGIWSMHFLGMLAVSLPIQLRYDIGQTFGSLAVAIVTSGFAIRIASSPKLKLTQLAVCSVVMGTGIASMHYMGMGAIRITPAIAYDPLLLAVSIAIAIVASFVALWLTFVLRSARYGRSARLGAAIVMGLAIAGMHFTGMAAANFAPGAVCLGGVAFNDNWLALSVGIATIAVLAITLMSLVFEAHLESGVRLHAQRLEEVNASLRHQVTHDALTGLPNRALFIERLQQAIDSPDSLRPLVAVIFVDLDRFKVINDLRGHSDGDVILKEVSTRLRQHIGEAGTAARLGGDEFLVLVQASDSQSVRRAAQDVIQRLSEPYYLGSVEIHLTASAGVTTFPFDGARPSALVSHADEAMYDAKNRGGNGLQFFVPGTTIFSPERLQLENDLWHAADKGQLELHYQPKVEIATGQIVGVEGLLRWRHPVHGWIPPGEFIPLAEASDLIVEIGRWTLDQACRQAQIWRSEGLRHLSIAINLSARQFRHPQAVSMIQKAIEQYELSTRDIDIEVTESIVMCDSDHSIETLDRLAHLGLKIAVDDFGTGYSSISYLKRLPVNILKIDRSFIVDLGTSVKSNAIVKAVISLAHSLGMLVVAEGVETDEQLVQLRSFSCNQFQGYLCSKPKSAADLAPLLRRQMKSPTSSLDEALLVGSVL